MMVVQAQQVWCLKCYEVFVNVFQMLAHFSFVLTFRISWFEFSETEESGEAEYLSFKLRGYDLDANIAIFVS